MFIRFKELKKLEKLSLCQEVKGYCFRASNELSKLLTLVLLNMKKENTDGNEKDGSGLFWTEK